MNQSESMPKQFSHREAEQRISAFWKEERISEAEVDPNKKPFCVVIPPPNVTGILHMGHVLDNVPQDVMTRWHRMRGFSAVWIPGTDHAGIATQNVVKRALEREGIKITDLGREEFLKRVWEWKEKHGHIIIQQLQRLGCSCDWRRERFTMDEGLAKAVLTAFVKLYERGLIYRGKRMINWCTVCGTALADDEVEHANKTGSLWHVRYPILDSAGKPTSDAIIVATTRPETMLGDTGVAVHPDDDRYKALVGKMVLLPLRNRPIPIVADSFVDPKFGSGAVKLTPAHDPNDYQAGQRHSLPVDQVIGGDGKMIGDIGAYKGLDRYEARKKIVADLEAQGYLEKVDKHSHAVGECYRCKSVLEPLVSDQWFVKMRPLAEKASQAVVDGRINIVPDSEKHDYFHWMNNIQDWCISRQLWWGHRIPIYYCDGCGAEQASVEAPPKCAKCGAGNLRQDEDVLDTWFSSQLWPFSTLGWPEETPEFKYWYPNTWLMSGRDILFFWDARMIMAGLELTGEVPFRSLALHGLVRDSQGRKLSKSLGNSPDPLDLFDEFGTDAVRAAITLNYPMGRQDTKLQDDVYKEGQALIIKIWNASRLLLSNLSGKQGKFDLKFRNLSRIEDSWIVSRLSETIDRHDAYLNKNDLVHAFESVTQFFWNDFCDWYLEIIKPRLWGSQEEKEEALNVSIKVIANILKLAHPYIPFVTEELWQIFTEHGLDSGETRKSIALASWPQSSDFPKSADADKRFQMMISIVRGIRDVRQHLLIPPKADLRAKLWFINGDDKSVFDSVEAVTRSMGYIKSFEVTPETQNFAQHVPFKFDGGVGYLSLPSDINADDLAVKLKAKIDKLDKALQGIQQKLDNPEFIANAPEALVTESRAKANELKEAMSKLEDFRKSLK